MFASGYFAPQHFAPQHFPPVVEFEIQQPGGSGTPPTVRGFVPIPRRDDNRAERFEAAKQKLAADARRKLLRGLDAERVDLEKLEKAIAEAAEQLTARQRVVRPDISRADILLPSPFETAVIDDDLNLRLLLLLGL